MAVEYVNRYGLTPSRIQWDRLCRFAFELFEQIFGLYQVKLVVLDSGETEQTSQSELCEDILSIMQIYACRKMGKRRYSKTNK